MVYAYRRRGTDFVKRLSRKPTRRFLQVGSGAHLGPQKTGIIQMYQMNEKRGVKQQIIFLLGETFNGPLFTLGLQSADPAAL